MTVEEILLQNNIPQAQSRMFETYYKMLIEWNEKINLTALTSVEDVAYKHFIDCISIFRSGVISLSKVASSTIDAVT